MFVAPILAGTKPQTIRADRKRHAREGETLQLYTGMRTRHCRLIGRAICASVQPIRIEVDNAVIGFASGLTLTTIAELDAFAATDGFQSWFGMREFWKLHHPLVSTFSGIMIRWRDFQPAMTLEQFDAA